MDLNTKLLNSIAGKAWKKIGIRHRHGIHLPLFSLHTEKSCGIGEFFDLFPLIDWCHDLGMDFIQLLPLNDIDSEFDPSPYNAISSCALSFLFLSLHALPFLDLLPHLEQELSQLRKLTSSQKICYPEVTAQKRIWLEKYCTLAGDKIMKMPDFQKFEKKNRWLNPYALFKALKIHYKQTPWELWPQETHYPTPDALKKLYSLHEREMSPFLLIQFLCFAQMKQVKAHAQKKGIFLMGDIPILLSKESADVWEHSELFDTHLFAGAPPDMYSDEGQNWGFPIFKWDTLKKTDFKWWKSRIHYAENFFDIFRLDHVMGYFRIWTIPPNQKSKEGFYIPQNEKDWGPQGKEFLWMLCNTTTLLPIAENLGIVPKIVNICLEESGICGIKVLRWERNWQEESKSFIPIQNYSPLSLSCVSTHDSETLAGWWSRQAEESQAYAKSKGWIWTPQLTCEQRESILWESHHTPSLFHGNLLQEYLSFFPDLIGSIPEEERINTPGTHCSSNWSYRFKPSVEKITSHKPLFVKIKKIIS